MDRQNPAPPTETDSGDVDMDGGNVSVLDRILQAHRDRRRNAANAYMLALQSSVVAGESGDDIEHEHRQFYLRGLDLMRGEVEL